MSALGSFGGTRKRTRPSCVLISRIGRPVCSDSSFANSGTRAASPLAIADKIVVRSAGAMRLHTPESKAAWPTLLAEVSDGCGGSRTRVAHAMASETSSGDAESQVAIAFPVAGSLMVNLGDGDEHGELSGK